MKPLIDGDILRYEIGAIGDIDGPKSFDFVASVLDGRIQDICTAVKATEPPTIYLTGSTNFREKVAVTKPYKGQRKQEKPFHFQNITVYLYNQYEIRMEEGLEADDLMSIDQVRGDGNTIVCTRDKDLRMVPGWHYGWECGAQREYGPVFVEDSGSLHLRRDKKPAKLEGNGRLFFYSQLLTGDTVDNIPGCPGVGAVKAFTLLEKADDPYKVVKETYEEKGLSDEYFMEQANLLWIVRELTEEGQPVLWTPPS